MATRPGRRLSRALSEAVASGDVEGVRKALDSGAGASEPDETGNLPLNSAAILAGSVMRVFSTDPAVMARFRTQPKDHLAVIRLLVERGARIEARNRHGMTPLHGAAMAGNAAAAALLLELGADPNARRGRCDDVEMEGATPLHHVCAVPRQERLVDSLEPLLAAGADPDARTKTGLTPLHLLCRAMGSPNALEALQRLLAAGADPTLADASGYTALTVLVDEADSPFPEKGVWAEARRLLLAGGAAEASVAPLRLLHAAGAGDLAAVSAALDQGADPGFTARRGGSALHAAAEAGHLDVVRLLLEAGADPNAGKPHRRPLDLAPAGSAVERYLEERGALRTTLAAERGCPSLALTQQVLVVRAPGADVVGALERMLSPVRVERGVKGRTATIGTSSLLVYQLAGHRWTAVQPVSGKPAASRFDRALGAGLSQALGTQVVLYESSDFTGTFGWELLESGVTEELYCAGDRRAPSHLVPWSHAAAFAAGRDEDDQDRGVYYSRSGGQAPSAHEAEEFLDRRARQLDLLVPPWPPQALAAKAGSRKEFFAGDRDETFTVVDYLVLEA